MNYDMRSDLNPSRLTIAMWDFSWLHAHYPGGSFEDFDKVTDELLERGFNTVRIEAFPWIIGQLKEPGELVTIPGAPLANWGLCDIDRQHDVTAELIEFMQITQKKNINVILSTWGKAAGCKEYPEQAPEQFRAVWEKTLDLLGEHDLLSHVLYVDLDQEFPYFSAYQNNINDLGEHPITSQNAADAMEAAGKRKPQRGLPWNDDHPDLRWDWLKDWCMECNALAAEYKLWGSTPWNFCPPYWDNWSDIAWYPKANNAFAKA